MRLVDKVLAPLRVGPADSGRKGPVLQELRAILEEIRSVPPGTSRVARINGFIRTLGSRANLALVLEHLRGALHACDGHEAAIARRSCNGRMHCLYGWAGQTLILASSPHATSGTEAPVDDMEFLGYAPAEWDLSIHIWQVNPEVERPDFRGTDSHVAEPPHTHPFDFASYVSIGHLHQSIYSEYKSATAADAGQRNATGTSLYRVDGIWPPHTERHVTELITVENCVPLTQGHSYFMPRGMIHDVEVERAHAARTPAITLFLSCEAVVKPRAYVSQRMVQFHEAHPDLKEHGEALEPSQWDAKLAATAAYLRGDSATLCLDDIVRCSSSYAFLDSPRKCDFHE